MKLALVALALSGAAVHADPKKPLKPDVAKAAAVNFAKAVINIDDTHPKAAELAAVEKYVTLPFRLYVSNKGKAICDTTVTDKAQLADAFVCLRNGPSELLPLRPYTATVLKELGDLKAHKAEIEKLAKTRTVLHRDDSSEGTHILVFVAVTADADGNAKVDAVITGYESP